MEFRKTQMQQDEYENTKIYHGIPAFMAVYESAKVDQKALRATLLERCKRIETGDKLGNYINFTPSVFLDKEVVMFSSLNAAIAMNQVLLRDVSAACEFWAWELEQRAKETQGG